MENIENNEVLIGGAPCEVKRATSSMLTVLVGITPSGTHPVVVRITGKGAARMDTPLTFTVSPTVGGLSQYVGSQGGESRCHDEPSSTHSYIRRNVNINH